ncbi:uncharacterized protein LOC107795531 [Nicotiana tabacum]|uniref:Uncharacterized protein LOC107795531 n=1 Tax=Nicotiana tabacum TaxID=4097 RepID=A0AC58UPF6_TOBAC
MAERYSSRVTGCFSRSTTMFHDPVDGDYEPLTTYFPDEEVFFAGEDIAESYPGWRIFFDGATNFKRNGSRQEHQELLVIGDFDLLIHQVQGEWSTKNVKILPYLHYLKELCRKFMKIEFKHIPSIQNKFANALATLSSMIQHPDKNYIDPIKVEIRDQHSYCFHVDEEPDGKPWYHDIRKFLATRE